MSHLESRYEIGWLRGPELFGYQRTKADALESARYHAQRRNDTTYIYDRLAHAGAWEIWHVQPDGTIEATARRGVSLVAMTA